MVKRPGEALKEFAKAKLDLDRRIIEFNYSKADEFITWLIGFAIGAISLIVSNLELIHKNVPGIIKPTVLLFAITIFFGLAYRYSSFLFVIKFKKLESYFEGVFSEHNMTPIEYDPDYDNASFEVILFALAYDFNRAPTFPADLSEEIKKVELPKLKKYYKELCERSKKEYEIENEYWAEVDETAFKLNKQKSIDKLMNPSQNFNIGFNLRRWALITDLLYLLSLLFFVSTVIVISIRLLHSPF
ncbi:MAG: hypothetical protein C5B52_02860 [Bacteroidetes bacterium]|nr:MAG: hypothetical protein C5B52_02860 [Bacteroidota bacterium]